ncbi:fused MFS/spermidine synthase [Nocardioides sp. QY071]|uniref:spermidine synthase n=1 Tax=Nocardioides sp. QY071 TaxID=3044187 RepID=UPI00249A2618|nr:fused MFS/spermidine synthase [Nocardioides sp. QY071]WGY04212.1 fused MFS/spermidine synthase [Nocardioides sp. QY071]
MGGDLYILDLDDMQQSAVDLGDPTRLVFDYVRRIGDLLDVMPAGPLRVLHVGGAAMTLPRYVAATRPRSAQIVLEPATEVVERVRAEAPLPPRSGIKVRPVDGETGILAVREGSQDVVVLDAFAGGRVPESLTSAGFVEQVGRVLAPDGMFVANLVDRPPYPRVRAFVAAVRALGDVAVGAEPATLKGRREGNLVVASGEVPAGAFGEPSPLAYRVFRGRAVADAFGGGKAAT